MLDIKHRQGSGSSGTLLSVQNLQGDKFLDRLGYVVQREALGQAGGQRFPGRVRMGLYIIEDSLRDRVHDKHGHAFGGDQNVLVALCDGVGVFRAEVQFHYGLTRSVARYSIGGKTNLAGMTNKWARAPMGRFAPSGVYQASTQTSPTLPSIRWRLGFGPSSLG